MNELRTGALIAPWMLLLPAAPLIVGLLCRGLPPGRRLAILIAVSIPIAASFLSLTREAEFAFVNIARGALDFANDNHLITSGHIIGEHTSYYASVSVTDLGSGDEWNSTFALARIPTVSWNTVAWSIVLSALAFGMSSIPARKVPNPRSATIPAP